MKDMKELEQRAAHQAKLLQDTLEQTEKRAAEREEQIKSVSAQKAAALEEAAKAKKEASCVNVDLELGSEATSTRNMPAYLSPLELTDNESECH
eukprot:224970-Pyramimonas_sp.AAC.1